MVEKGVWENKLISKSNDSEKLCKSADPLGHRRLDPQPYNPTNPFPKGGGFTPLRTPRWKLPLTSHVVWDIFIRVRVLCAMCRYGLCVACCMVCSKRWSQEASKRDAQNGLKIPSNFRKIGVKIASRSAPERLLRHLEASQGLGVALKAYKVSLESA